MPVKMVSESQWNILLAFMTANPVFALGKAYNQGSMATTTTTEKWRQLAFHLNVVEDGLRKSPRKWMEYWNNAKYSVRKKACARRQQSGLTGDVGLPKRLIHLTDKEEQILAILKKMGGQGEYEDLPTSLDARTLPSPFLVSTIQSPHPTLSTPPTSPSSFATAAANVTIQRDHDVAPTPDWVHQLEERTLAEEERTAKAFETIAVGLAGLEAILDAMRQEVLEDSYNRT